MNFNSATFALFILIVGAIYSILRMRRQTTAQKAVLLASSYLFYGTWDHRFLFLIIFSTAVDYICGLGIVGRRPSKRSARKLAAGLAGASLLLCTPIDWAAISTRLLPASVFSAGLVETEPSSRILLASPDWLPLFGGLGATLALGLFALLGARLEGQGRRRYFLLMSLISNLGLLAFFKYFDFFVESAEGVLTMLGVQASDWRLGIFVPVGISFYTFQTLSYTIDIYRGELEPTESTLDFALFVSFFPQLVAGPIERARVLLPQIASPPPITRAGLESGTWLVAWGLFKKIFIADALAKLVDPAYEIGASPGGPEIVLSTYAFAFQIYCDFSGYTDIARGISRLMGIELMVNFNVPYAASNPKEFWRRWHISLSTWLRDYLYVSLGGNRGGPAFVYRNLMLTMVLGGLWHGARANFLLWGVYQGSLLCLHRMLEPHLRSLAPRGPLAGRFYRVVCWILFFQLVCYGWLIFRVETGTQAIHLTRNLFTDWDTLSMHLSTLKHILFRIWPLLLVQLFQVRSRNLLAPLEWHAGLRWATYLAIFYLASIFGEFDVTEFIYFQF